MISRGLRVSGWLGSIALVAAMTCLVAPVEAGYLHLANIAGFHFESPDPHPGEWLAVGDGFEVIGFVTAFGPRLAPYHQPATHEYTFRFSDLVVTDASFDALTQTLIVEFADNGHVRFFEDARATGTPAQYGVDPPSTAAPASFVDGVLLLDGDLDRFSLFYDFQFDQGESSGSVDFREGVWVSSGVLGPADGWTAWGLVGRGLAAPTGYDGPLCGEIRLLSGASATGVLGGCSPVPVARSTWGSIKRTYR